MAPGHFPSWLLVGAWVAASRGDSSSGGQLILVRVCLLLLRWVTQLRGLGLSLPGGEGRYPLGKRALRHF